MTAPIDIENLGRRFGQTTALAGVDLHIEAGEYCVLLGPSGCGKTTLLNIIGGFMDADRGTLKIGGMDMAGIPAAKRPTTTVFQDYALFPHMTLEANVSFGLRMRKKTPTECRRIADAMLTLVGLAGQGKKRPSELSGGQRQRVALARALAVEPDVLLLDEPLGALDLNLRRSMQEELKAIQRRVGATFVHVTHDQEEAMAIADRIVVMNAGKIEDQGPPERVYRQPATRFAAAFLGEMNFIPATVRGGTYRTALGVLGSTKLPDNTKVSLAIRPEHIDPIQPHPIGAAHVTETVFQGVHRRIRAVPEADPSLELLALLPVGQDAVPGDTLALAIDMKHVTVLPED